MPRAIHAFNCVAVSFALGRRCLSRRTVFDVTMSSKRASQHLRKVHRVYVQQLEHGSGMKHMFPLLWSQMGGGGGGAGLGDGSSLLGVGSVAVDGGALEGNSSNTAGIAPVVQNAVVADATADVGESAGHTSSSIWFGVGGRHRVDTGDEAGVGGMGAGDRLQGGNPACLGRFAMGTRQLSEQLERHCLQGGGDGRGVDRGTVERLLVDLRQSLLQLEGEVARTLPL